MSEGGNHTDRLKEAREFALGNTSTEYLLVHKRDAGPEVRSLEFRRDVQDELEKLVGDVLTEYIDKVRDGSRPIRDMSAVNTVSDAAILQHAPIEGLPQTDVVQILAANREYPSARYDSDDPPDFQLIKITDGNKTLIGVQNHGALKTYNASKRGIPLMYRGDVYSKFEGDLLIVPESLNAIYFDGHVYVISPKSFEKMFEMREEYKQQATRVIDLFKESGITFADDKIPEEWMKEGDIRILRKLYTIHENEIPKHATPQNIAEIIDKYDVNVLYSKQNGTIELDIERYVDIWKLLKVLNSDYAEAELIPDARLEIDSKRIIRD